MGRSIDKQSFWREQIRQAAKFDGTQLDFCRSKGLSLATSQYWKKKLKRSLWAPAVPFAQVEVERFFPTVPDPRWVAELIRHLHQGGDR